MERSGVIVTTLSPRGLPSPAFSVHHEEVGRMAAAEMIANNHRRIGVFIGTYRTIVLDQRLRGATEVLDAAGVSYRVASPVPGSRGIEAIADMFAADPDITGIIAASSLMSAHVVGAVTATGRSVPKDVSVIGIGGSALAEWSPLKLTRIDLDLNLCGQEALDYIAAQVNGSEHHSPAPLQPHLVRGDSVRRLT
jgi:LacI family transcriptional regulator